MLRFRSGVRSRAASRPWRGGSGERGGTGRSYERQPHDNVRRALDALAVDAQVDANWEALAEPIQSAMPAAALVRHLAFWRGLTEKTI